MRWRRTEEVREAARAEVQARRARRAETKHQAAHAASPIGQAEAATERGDRFLEIREAYSYVTGAQLGQIEDLGWRLEHVGYVFVHHGSTTTVYSSEDSSTKTDGAVQGIYLFRSTVWESRSKPGMPDPKTPSAAPKA